jgi:excisionase family DNA binding protein
MSPVSVQATSLPSLNDPVLSIQQVAADLGVSRRTVYDWVHKGILEPPRRLGLRRVGYLKSTIDQFKVGRPAAFMPRGLDQS